MAHTPRVNLTIKGTCTIVSTGWVICPLCQREVPPNTVHECERDGAVTVVRQRQSKNVIADAVEAIASSRR